MPVEMRLEDVPAVAAAAVPEAGRGDPPAALRDLIAARLVSHEAIGDPARLGAEAAALRALCGLVAGPVYRLEPFHYAFMLRPGDPDGAALDAGLADALGAEALWVGETALLPAEAADDLAADPAAGPAAEPDAGAATLSEAGLLVLRVQDAATGGAIAAADPALRAVVDARTAVEAARRAADLAAALGLEAAAATAADAATGALDRRIAALETRLEGLVADRMERRDAALSAALAAQAAETRAFEARLGLALAEFLARLERREGAAAAP